MSEIPCKKCTSPDCRGCNLLELSEALSDGRLNHYMDGNHRIHVPKRITLDASKFKAFSMDKTPGIERDNIRFAKSFVQEAYSWHNDIMEITRRIVHETDEARLSNIADHFEVDLSEIREFINKKQREKLHKKTQLDEIREMSAEQLASWLESKGDCPPIACPHDGEGPRLTSHDCKRCWLRWLKQEVEPDADL